MFDKCIKCNRMGESCVPNLMLLPFPDLLKWWDKRQNHLGWTNKKLADQSKVPVGTINRIKAGEEDCRYSTMKHILIALIGGISDEFSCTEQVERELRQLEKLEQQAAKLTSVEAENEALKEQLRTIDERHRQDIRIVRDEYQDRITFLREQITFIEEQLKAWQSSHPAK